MRNKLWTFLNCYIYFNDSRWTEVKWQGELSSEEVDILTSALTNNTHVQILSLENCGITGKNLQTIADLLSSNPNIIELNLSNNPLTDEDVARLVKAILSQNTLKKITLRGIPISNQGAESLANLFANNNSIVEVDLSNTQLNFVSLATIGAGICHLKKITALNLSTNLLDSTCLQLIEDILIKGTGVIEQIDLSNNKLFSKESAKIAARILAHSNCQVKYLNLSNTELDSDCLEMIADSIVMSNFTLIHLDISKNYISRNAEKSINALNKMLTHKNNQITELNLAHNRLEITICSLIPRILTHRYCNIIDLNLNSTQLSLESLIQITVALENKTCKLQNLDISNNNISSLTQFIRSLSNKNRSISTLKLSNMKLSIADLKLLCGYLVNESCIITSLDLSKNKLTDNSLKTLANILNNKSCSLTELNLSDNNFTDVGLQELKQTHALSILHLANNQITDKGAKLLEQILIKSNIGILNLSNNQITDLGAQYFAETLMINTLIELNLANNSITSSSWIDSYLAKMMVYAVTSNHDKTKQFVNNIFDFLASLNLQQVNNVDITINLCNYIKYLLDFNEKILEISDDDVPFRILLAITLLFMSENLLLGLPSNAPLLLDARYLLGFYWFEAGTACIKINGEIDDIYTAMLHAIANMSAAGTKSVKSIIDHAFQALIYPNRKGLFIGDYKQENHNLYIKFLKDIIPIKLKMNIFPENEISEIINSYQHLLKTVNKHHKRQKLLINYSCFLKDTIKLKILGNLDVNNELEALAAVKSELMKMNSTEMNQSSIRKTIWQSFFKPESHDKHSIAWEERVKQFKQGLKTLLEANYIFVFAIKDNIVSVSIDVKTQLLDPSVYQEILIDLQKCLNTTLSKFGITPLSMIINDNALNIQTTSLGQAEYVASLLESIFTQVEHPQDVPQYN